MAEPMPPKHRVSLSEILTIDDLINLISMKARTRGGRIVTGAASVALLAAIIVGPIVVRSSHGGAGPSSTPTIPVVTVPPSTNTPTAFEQTPIPAESAVSDRNYYGQKPGGAATTANTTPAPPATPAPTVTTPATLPQPVAPVTVPAPVVTSPPTVPFPQPTYPPTTPATTPPLTVPTGPIKPGG